MFKIAIQRSREILRVLFRHRRLHRGAGECQGHPCEECFWLHLQKVHGFVERREPLQLILPAFPAKSPSPRKVVGRLPDMAERLALGFLQRACEELESVYAPGARILICSDGRVFSDLVGIADRDVSLYGSQLAAEIRRMDTHALHTLSMEDLFEAPDFDAMRSHLVGHYADPLHVIEERARAHAPSRALFNGIQRFLFEDQVVLEPAKSRNQVRNECKQRAYQVIQRSGAWSRLLAESFPDALRLSIHPQPPHSEKIGIRLAEADEGWLTPWHAVAVQDPDGFRLMHRYQAEALGGRLVEERGRPSHYQIQ